jgi:hypothetical protein
MTDILMPGWLRHARNTIRYMDNTAVTRGLYTGAAQTTSLGGDRVAASIEIAPTGGKTLQKERAALIAFLANLRGKQNRAYLYDQAYQRRGSFPASELLTNNTFSNGTTGWQSSPGVLSANDRRLRITANGSGGSGLVVSTASSITLTQYAPYCVRGFYSGGNYSIASGVDARLGDATYGTTNGFVGTQSTVDGMVIASGVTLATAMYPGYGNFNTGSIGGQYYEIPYTSLSQCLLIDNGSNLNLYSEQFDNAVWTKTRTTVTANSVAAPNGSTTADTLSEDGSAATSHYIGQGSVVSASALDYTHVVSVKAGTRTWVRVSLSEITGGQEAYVFVNLATGEKGTTTVTGANWSNVRAYVDDQGGGWYCISVVARKTNAATTVIPYIYIAEGDNDVTFSGGSTASLYIWRSTLAQSSVPVRQVQTTSAATAGTAQTGSAVYVKGLPASTAGLLLPGDQFEVITSRGSELKFVTYSLDSNASGLGYLQFSPSLRGTVADNAAVIIHNPMGRFLFSGEFPEWSNDPGVITTASADFEEAL